MVRVQTAIGRRARFVAGVIYLATPVIGPTKADTVNVTCDAIQTNSVPVNNLHAPKVSLCVCFPEI